MYVDKIQTLVMAVPQNVLSTDFELDNQKENRTVYEKFNKKNKTLIVELAPNVTLYQTAEHIVLLDHDAQGVLYLVHYKYRSVFGKRTVTQIKVWASSFSEYTSDSFRIDGLKLTAFVFFKKLLPTADLITSDGQQTKDGQRFWSHRVLDAFNAGLYVYLIDQNKKTHIPLLNHKDLVARAKAGEVWGDAQKFRAIKIGLSAKKLW